MASTAEIIKNHTIVTNFGRYLNPLVTRDWKRSIIQKLETISEISICQLYDKYNIDIKHESKSTARKLIQESEVINVLGIGYSAKAAYENGIKHIKQTLVENHIKLHPKLDNFQAHLWNEFYHPDKLKLLMVVTSDNTPLYVLYNLKGD